MFLACTTATKTSPLPRHQMNEQHQKLLGRPNQSRLWMRTEIILYTFIVMFPSRPVLSRYWATGCSFSPSNPWRRASPGPCCGGWAPGRTTCRTGTMTWESLRAWQGGHGESACSVLNDTPTYWGEGKNGKHVLQKNKVCTWESSRVRSAVLHVPLLSCRGCCSATLGVTKKVN